jgi:hypothetical protein
MKLTELFLAELEREAPRTRRAIEQVPLDSDDWQPHPKSMPLGRLAELIIDQDELNLTPAPGQGTFQQPPTNTLLSVLDANVQKGRDSLSRTTDEFLLTTNWRLLAGGHVVMNQPRHIVLRDTMNHLAHHRGQLTVYLRLKGRTVPAIYGPSADDQQFA